MSATPQVVTGEIVDQHPEGPYHALTVAAPVIAATVMPGQFVSVAVDGPGTLLRRPFSVCGADGDTIELLYATTGEGTRWLAACRPGAALDVVGPLGVGFNPAPRPSLLVGGGYGSGPLLFLSARLRRLGDFPIELLVGAATAQRLLRPAQATAVSTEDGSTGQPGRVTDVMDALVERAGIEVVYACGPMPMLRSVAAVAARRGLDCQVAVEESMACGVGVCWTCVVPVTGPQGPANLRACIDGPVLDAAAVRWDAIRYAA